MDVVKNIKRMYSRGDGHVHVLAASVRHLDHLLASFALGVELSTVTTQVLTEWATKGFPIPDQDFMYRAVNAKGQSLAPLPYKEFDLNSPWRSFEVRHELTNDGIRKLVADNRATLKRSAQMKSMRCNRD